MIRNYIYVYGNRKDTESQEISRTLIAMRVPIKDAADAIENTALVGAQQNSAATNVSVARGADHDFVGSVRSSLNPSNR